MEGKAKKGIMIRRGKLKQKKKKEQWILFSSSPFFFWGSFLWGNKCVAAHLGDNMMMVSWAMDGGGSN